MTYFQKAFIYEQHPKSVWLLGCCSFGMRVDKQKSSRNEIRYDYSIWHILHNLIQMQRKVTQHCIR